MAENIDILPEEIQAVEKRITALATRTVPPVWGYAGVLLDMVEDGDIENVFDVYGEIQDFIDHPDMAEREFREWNAGRLAK